MSPEPTSMPPRVLETIRVLDLTRFLSGPQATLFLAALGAEVIRIDQPHADDPTFAAPPYIGSHGVSLHRRTPDDIGIAYLKRCRAKKAITLDPKCAEGRALFFRLIEQADVLVENFRPGVTSKLGIAYPELQECNPRLIHCAITGYGSTGPDRCMKAFDLMVQAATGLMSITGAAEGGPCKAGSPLSDGIAGTFAVTGILGALLQRERTGKGQFVDVAMADCLVSLIFDEPLDCYDGLGLALRQGNRIMRFSPFNTYATRDGTVTIGAATQMDWIALAHVMGRGDLLGSAEFMSDGWRIANNGAVDAVVSKWTADLTTAEVLERLVTNEIPCSPVRDVRDVMAWRHLRDRGMLQPLLHPDVDLDDAPLAPEFPLRFSGAATDYRSPAPRHGQHNDEIYRTVLGLTDHQLRELTDRGVI
jgi:crotonobetainyl-CoA:carnitine CoA-transferase CaiB-like acyl-CoA transferase